MHQVLQSEPITQLQRNYKDVLSRLPAGPVQLLQRSSVAAIMVSPEQWNALIAEIESFRRGVEANKHFQAMRNGEYVTEL